MIDGWGKLTPVEHHQWRKIDISSGNGFDAARQQTITRANVKEDLCRHMESPGHTELKSYPESSRLFPITMEPK